MSGKRSRKTEPKKANPGKIALIGAGATALALFNMATNGGEAPSQGVMILQYAGLGGGLLALVGGLIMMAAAKS
jgi:hypothetical protein